MIAAASEAGHPSLTAAKERQANKMRGDGVFVTEIAEVLNVARSTLNRTGESGDFDMPPCWSRYCWLLKASSADIRAVEGHNICRLGHGCFAAFLTCVSGHRDCGTGAASVAVTAETSTRHIDFEFDYNGDHIGLDTFSAAPLGTGAGQPLTTWKEHH